MTIEETFPPPVDMSSTALPKTFKAAVISDVGHPLELQHLTLELPSRGQILVKVLACGLCYTDAHMQAGLMGANFPRVPGHEIVGEVVSLGEGVTRFKQGDRVGSGYHGGHDGTCPPCQRGLLQYCQSPTHNGVTTNGGYAQFVLLRDEAVSRIPPDMHPAEAAPFLCAGVTIFNAIRRAHISPGSTVAIQGIGGLGHLGIQYARAMGYKTVAISSGDSKRQIALEELGAHEHIDTNSDDVVAKLQELGGAALIVSTAPSGPAMSKLIGGLQVGGKLVVLAPAGPVEFDTISLCAKGASVQGWIIGSALDAEEAMAFAKMAGIKCMVERFGLDEAPRAFELMKSGKPRFRNVLVME
ncbi:chaperonin 10-like protein [Cladorrhinum sp. PSN332]|nr:chaperonin 10-like protein [Cladorrhinum sp. PSN332]